MFLYDSISFNLPLLSDVKTQSLKVEKNWMVDISIEHRITIIGKKQFWSSCKMYHVWYLFDICLIICYHHAVFHLLLIFDIKDVSQSLIHIPAPTLQHFPCLHCFISIFSIYPPPIRFWSLSRFNILETLFTIYSTIIA